LISCYLVQICRGVPSIEWARVTPVPAPDCSGCNRVRQRRLPRPGAAELTHYERFHTGRQSALPCGGRTCRLPIVSRARFLSRPSPACHPILLFSEPQVFQSWTL